MYSRILPILFLLTFSFPADAGKIRDFIEKRRNDDATRQVRQDIAYGTHPRQTFDVYSNPASARAPIILMVHGGAWKIGDKKNSAVVRNKAAYWLPKGYVFISTNYRMIGDAADPMTQAQDVAAALAFVQHHAPTWGGDPSRIILMGHSAGAHLAALLSADPALAQAMGAKPWLGTVVLDSGAVNVPDIMRLPHAGFYDDAFGKDTVFWERVSPLHRLTKNALPMFFVCSTSRKDKPCLQAENFSRKASEYGVKTAILPQDLSHGEINSDLGLPGRYTEAVDAFITSLLQ